MIGFYTLFYKEVLRFSKVAFQTIGAPVITALLYLMVFQHTLGDTTQLGQVAYQDFLIPGLVMMSILQNAFSNSSSSLIQSKITGNIVFVLLSPLSHLEIFGAYVLASFVRAVLVGGCVFLFASWITGFPLLAEPLWMILFGALSALVLSILGVIAGILTIKFDQLAAFQNFIIMPATFLAGVFYSIHSLPPIWQWVSHFNPFFYMVDGFRYGFFGVSDVAPLLSFLIVGVLLLILTLITLVLLKTGYKLRE